MDLWLFVNVRINAYWLRNMIILIDLHTLSNT